MIKRTLGTVRFHEGFMAFSLGYLDGGALRIAREKNFLRVPLGSYRVPLVGTFA